MKRLIHYNPHLLQLLKCIICVKNVYIYFKIFPCHYNFCLKFIVNVKVVAVMGCNSRKTGFPSRLVTELHFVA